jgi:hypothetical protein
MHYDAMFQFHRHIQQITSHSTWKGTLHLTVAYAVKCNSEDSTITLPTLNASRTFENIKYFSVLLPFVYPCVTLLNATLIIIFHIYITTCFSLTRASSGEYTVAKIVALPS